MNLETAIYMKGVPSDTVIREWSVMTDVTCLVCNKTQSYANYSRNKWSCILCGNKEKPPILLLDESPIVMDNHQQIENIEEELESILIATQLLGYQKPEYRLTSTDQPCIRISFQSQERNKLIQLILFMTDYGNFRKASLRTGHYKQWSSGKKLDSKDIFYLLNEMKKVI